MSRIRFLCFLFITSFYSLQAQDCFEFHKEHCEAPTSKYSYMTNQGSVSFKFESGELKEIPFTIMAGKDYRFTLCAGKAFEQVIAMRFIRRDGKVLYDNSKHNYSLNTEFSCLNTRDITIEIEAPDPATGIADTIYTTDCIGLLIQEMVSIKTGF